VVRSDIRHAKTEKRYYALGQTTAGSLLFVVFTVRRHIRVISAWNMNRNETNSYKRMKKKLPKFKDEDNERKFWATADSTEYVDWRSGKAQETRAPQTISKDDLVEALSRDIQDLKVLANRRDVPYQFLLKVFLAERLARKRESRSGSIANGKIGR